ncbi:MAG: DUF2283 domain-containing protein [Gemmatimonadota bacterium]|nr:DUF2283 domain-containing protein [Gemmatimonadota bacterium]
MKAPREHGTLDWEYDSDADVLYLSVGSPRPAIGIDVGDGLIVRYDETTGEILGLTVLDLMSRLTERLGVA